MAATGSLKEKQRQERERLILQAANELLEEKGFHEMSMDDVALRVGVSKGTVYLHFPSKDDLLFAVITNGMGDFVTTLEDKLGATGTPRARLSALIEYTYGQVRQYMQLVMAITEANPELRKRLVELSRDKATRWETLNQRLAEVIDEGKATGDFVTTLPTTIMVMAFMSLLIPRHQKASPEPELASPEEVARGICGIFFDGIAARSPQTTEGLLS